jgi:hypothetical protein
MDLHELLGSSNQRKGIPEWKIKKVVMYDMKNTETSAQEWRYLMGHIVWKSTYIFMLICDILSRNVDNINTNINFTTIFNIIHEILTNIKIEGYYWTKTIDETYTLIGNIEHLFEVYPLSKEELSKEYNWLLEKHRRDVYHNRIHFCNAYTVSNDEDCKAHVCRDKEDPILMGSIENPIKMKVGGVVKCYELKSLYKWIEQQQQNKQHIIKEPTSNIPFTNAQIDKIKASYKNLEIEEKYEIEEEYPLGKTLPFHFRYMADPDEHFD